MPNNPDDIEMVAEELYPDDRALTEEELEKMTEYFLEDGERAFRKAISRIGTDSK